MTGNMLLDLAGPSDVFTVTDNCLQARGIEDGYEVMIASATADRKLKANTGLELLCPYYAAAITDPIDTLIIAGNDFREQRQAELEPFFNWLASADQRGIRRIASICGGAFALAKAGLLNGRRATTHWEMSDRLRAQYPEVKVDTNPFFINDGPVYTSAGVSSGIDLSLAMVEEDHGKDIAIKVARKLVFYLSRPGFQSQFGNLLPVYESAHIATQMQDWLTDHLHEGLDISRVASQLNMSARNFTRVFHRETGMPPAKFIEKMRVETARKYLEDTDMPLERIAERCGLGGLVSMRRTFLRHLMTTPSDYRRNFRTALKDTQTIINS